MFRSASVFPRSRIVAVGALLAPLLAAPAHAGLEVCNQTNVARWLSVGYFDDGVNEAWTSEGWWEVLPGECVVPIEDDLSQRFYYYRAEDPEENFTGDPGKTFCSVDDAYTIVGNQDCEARNYETLEYLEVDTGEANAIFTLVLNPNTVPGALPIGAEPSAPDPMGTDEGQAAETETETETETLADQDSADATAGSSPFGGAVATLPGDDGDPLAETYQAILGSWRQVDDRAARITFNDDMYARYRVNELIETGPFEIASACPGEAGASDGDPVVVVRLPGKTTPECLDVLYVDDATLEMLTYPDGRLLRFEASAN